MVCTEHFLGMRRYQRLKATSFYRSARSLDNTSSRFATSTPYIG
jgi:hypothetical protein